MAGGVKTHNPAAEAAQAGAGPVKGVLRCMPPNLQQIPNRHEAPLNSNGGQVVRVDQLLRAYLFEQESYAIGPGGGRVQSTILGVAH